VFVDAAVGVSFGQNGLEAVHLAGTFDEQFSASIRLQFRPEGSAGFSPAAIRQLDAAQAEKYRR
jgi:ABC-type uncharacterized transport system substrate-binding protein